MKENEYIVEPQSQSEEYCLRMGRRSFRRSNSILGFAITFLLASLALAGSLFFTFRDDPAGLTRWVMMGLAWVWTCLWAGAALLFHVHRTYYRMIKRLSKKEANS